jgi:hypothetical protein
MKTIPIGTILEQLPEQTRTKVQELLLRPDVLEHVTELRQLLEPHRKALERIGLVPGYTAYVMAYMVAQQTQQAKPEPEPAPHLIVTVELVDPYRALDFIRRN